MSSVFPSRLPALRRSALVCACLLALSAPAFAAAADEATTDLDAVKVNAYKPAQTANSSTKTDTALIEVPQSVSVIERKELDARGVQNLNDATRYNAGVLAESQGIDNRVDDLYIRGFDAGSWSDNVTLDGMRAPQGGQWIRSKFDTWNMERVEVLKGPSAVLYGQVAPGGMVNQVSKTPDPDQVQQLRLSVDINGRYQSAFDVGGQGKDERLLWRLVGLYSDGATQIDHVDTKHWFLAPSATWRFSDDTRLTLLGMYQKDDGGSTYQFLPYTGTVVPTQYGYIDNTTFLGEPNWNTYNREVSTAGWLFEHHFNDSWSLSQSARYTHVDALYRATVASGGTLTDDRLLNRRATQGVGSSDGYTADTRLQGHFATGAVEHTVLAGVDWQQAKWDFERRTANVSASAIAIDVYAPVYTYYDFASVLTTISTDTAETDRQTGAYFQDQLALGNWRFTAGGRYDWVRNNSLNRKTDVRTITDEQAFTGRAAAMYLFDNGLAPYVSYSESFQPATGTDRNGDGFDPTTGKQWEAGLKYQPASIDGMLTLSAYDLRQQNVLTADPLNDADENYQVQSGEVRIRGLELEGRVTPLEGLSVIGAVTRMDSEITKNNDGDQGNRMIRVPDWMGSLWLDYTFQAGALRGFAVAVGGRYVGQTYGDTANTLSIQAYTLFDAALRYDAGRVGPGALQFALNGSNLADKRYVGTCTAVSACYYGSGRTVTATATFSW
jgi:iron complex outermembrane recepter protein